MNLTAARLNRGLSLADAAAEIGISRGTLKRAEAGQLPRADRAKSIADFYGCQVTDIWPVDEPTTSAAA